MLFRTVYGPELEAIYFFIAKSEVPLARKTIHAMFMSNSETKGVSTQSVDDALSFLESARLIEEKRGYYQHLGLVTNEPFRVRVLRQLRALEQGKLEALHPIDPLYMLILTELFIHPNQLFMTDIHSQANKLRPVTNAGGLSREKLQAWKRVMEFLGVGQRVVGGFRCAYSPQLLLEIIDQWSETENTLQLFFEEYFDATLPYQTWDGNLAQAIESPLIYLNSLGCIVLSPRQDSPSKPYFGEQKFRYITRLEVAYAVIRQCIQDT